MSEEIVIKLSPKVRLMLERKNIKTCDQLAKNIRDLLKEDGIGYYTFISFFDYLYSKGYRLQKNNNGDY